MITLAREARGWTQRELADAIGLTQAMLSRYEIDLHKPPMEQVAAIARTLDFDDGFFYQTDRIYGLGGDFLYRRRAQVPAKAKKRVEAEANIRKMQVARLLRGARIEESFPFPQVVPDKYSGRVELIAEEVRHAWRIPAGPIRNLSRVVEGAGGIIFIVDFETDRIDGTNIRVPGLPPMLFLSANASGERHRFNIAHELGHAIMHFTTAFEEAEEQANSFAAEFLMPRKEIRSDLKRLDLPAAARLKEFWGVSSAAIVQRAKALGQISDATYRRLFAQLGASGQRVQEFNPLPFEKSELFSKLLDFHRVSLGFTESEMRALLFTNRLGTIPAPEKLPLLRLVGLFEA